MILDLHGKTHSDAKSAIEFFLNNADYPVYIITGNSNSMKNILEKELNKRGLYAYYLNPNNLGKILISDKQI